MENKLSEVKRQSLMELLDSEQKIIYVIEEYLGISTPETERCFNPNILSDMIERQSYMNNKLENIIDVLRSLKG